MHPTSVSAPADGLVEEFQRSLKNEAVRLMEATRAEATQLNSPLYLVGGPVRDLMLHRRSEDLDLVTEGDVEALATRVSEAFGSKAVLHRRFGTATVRCGTVRMDLATARKESYARPGALPKVTAGTIEEDLLRRDFTINAMALGLMGRHKGRLLDPSGGTADLREGVVRILHRQSFEDDATRIFRGVRYEQRLGFRMDSDTLERLTEALAGGMLATVSADRLRHELELILVEERAVQTLLRAGELGAMKSLYAPLKRVEWLGEFGEGSGSLALVAALAFGMSPAEAQGLVARLNTPSSWSDAVMGMVRLASVTPTLEDSTLTPSQLYRALEGCPIASIDAMQKLTHSEAVSESLAHYSQNLQFVKPILRGGDLVELGVPEGPAVGEILRRIQDARLDGEVTSRSDECKLAIRLSGGVDDRGSLSRIRDTVGSKNLNASEGAR